MLTPVGAHGEGSITRRKDGRLQVAVTMLNGRRVYRYIPRDRDAARQKRLAAKALRTLQEARDRDLEPERQTLGDFLRSWMEGLRDAPRPRIRPRTIEHYGYVVDQYLIPGLGGHRLDRLSERHIQAWLDRDTGSARSVHHHRAVLRRALNVAVRQRIIARNPALAVELPEAPEFKGRPLTRGEAARLFESSANDRLAALWRLAVATGLRLSELLGLAWDDVDLEAGTLRAHAQLYRGEDGWELVRTKAARTRELIHVDPAAIAALREHQRRMAGERRPSWRYFGLVFVNTRGDPLQRSEVLRLFHAACDRAGIARRRFHDLRGSSATLMQEAGVPEDVRMARLGHATTRMARHYAPVRDDTDRRAAAALGKLLR